MKFLTYVLAIIMMSAIMMSAVPAFAHTGDHSLTLTAAALHGLTSPTHLALSLGLIASISMLGAIATYYKARN